MSRQASAVTSSRKPGQSKRTRASVSSRSGRNRLPIRTATALTGTATVKIARQLKCSIITPPSTGPSAGPRITLMPKKPIAVPRCSGGNTRNSVYMENGCSRPATAPCTMRQKMSTDSLGLAPASSSEAAKMLSAAMKVRRCPKFDIIQALSSMPTVIAASVPVDSH